MSLNGCTGNKITISNFRGHAFISFKYFFFPIRITLYKIQICGNRIVLKKTDIDSDINCFGIAHLSRSG